MSDVIIQVENLSKQYRLGEVSTGTLAHDLNRWWHRVRDRDDPYLKVTQANVREKRATTESAEKAEGENGGASRGSAFSSDYVWALREVSFEVRRGEVLGIIGRNGAGKSTLLKILSRVTAPTEGEVRIDGRIASLLEVGTGFHPDLTGRENIFLNGAILGMSKGEIRGKLDEIVEFSGCARYLDTPVKRYSSGMVVRLGFAVAAHLEPDILIVDEVLAVGDAEFQKKCMGKMQDVAGHGRTVLFVSHNMDSIRALTERCLVLAEGRISTDAPTEQAIGSYIGLNEDHGLVGAPKAVEQLPFEKRILVDPAAMFISLGLAPGARAEIPSGGTLSLEVGIDAPEKLASLTLGYTVLHESTAVALVGWSGPFDLPRAGQHKVILDIRNLDLAPGTYDLRLSINRGGLTEAKHTYDLLLGAARFRVGAFRPDGGVLPPWKSGWGHVIHAHSSVKPIPVSG